MPKAGSPHHQSKAGVWSQRARTALVSALAVIGVVSLGTFVIAFWAEQQILNTDAWVETVSPLPQQSVVSSALGGYIADQVFDAAQVEQNISNALPPRASFLANPLADQLHSLTTRAATRVVASDAFTAIWTAANRSAMNRLLAKARGPSTRLEERINSRFDIDLSPALARLRTALGSGANAVPALQATSQKAIVVRANLQLRQARVRQFIQTLDFLYAVLPFAATAALLGALAIARDRRRTMAAIAVGVVVICLAELVAIKGAQQWVLSNVHNASAVDAVSYIYGELVGWLRQALYWVLMLAALVFLIGLAAGPSTWARRARGYVRFDYLRQNRMAVWWQALRSWVWRWQYYVWIAAAILVLGGLAAFTTITLQSICNAVLLAFSIIALTHLLARPTSEPQTTRL